MKYSSAFAMARWLATMPSVIIPGKLLNFASGLVRVPRYSRLFAVLRLQPLSNEASFVLVRLRIASKGLESVTRVVRLGERGGGCWAPPVSAPFHLLSGVLGVKSTALLETVEGKMAMLDEELRLRRSSCTAGGSRTTGGEGTAGKLLGATRAGLGIVANFTLPGVRRRREDRRGSFLYREVG